MTTSDLANNLIHYIRSTMNQSLSIPFDFSLTPFEIDNIVGRLNSTAIINTTNAFLMVVSPDEENDTIIGLSFQSNAGGQLIRNSNQYEFINSNLSVLAMISPDSLRDVTHLNMLLIDKPDYYHRFTNSTNEILLSAIIVAKIQRNQSSFERMNISLYFTKQWNDDLIETATGYFVCSYYDTNYSRWNESGCTLPVYNAMFSRYECHCNHLTTFALLYRINSSSSTTISTQESTISSSVTTLSQTSTSLETTTVEQTTGR